jgi:DNA-binding XRE family transcriptional regulator
LRFPTGGQPLFIIYKNIGLTCASQPITMKKSKRDEDKSQVALLRNRVGKTQFQVAVEIGVSNTTVRDWERGSIPAFDKAISLARCYGVSLKELAISFGLSVDGIPDDVSVEKSPR